RPSSRRGHNPPSQCGGPSVLSDPADGFVVAHPAAAGGDQRSLSGTAGARGASVPAGEDGCQRPGGNASGGIGTPPGATSGQLGLASLQRAGAGGARADAPTGAPGIVV